MLPEMDEKTNRAGVPELTSGQRAEALEAAAAMRAERAKIRVDLKAGDVTPEEVLYGEGPACRGMRLYTFLTACPGVGSPTARRLVREAGSSEARRLQGLGRRQRRFLADALALIAAGTHPTEAIGRAKSA